MMRNVCICAQLYITCCLHHLNLKRQATSIKAIPLCGAQCQLAQTICEAVLDWFWASACELPQSCSSKIDRASLTWRPCKSTSPGTLPLLLPITQKTLSIFNITSLTGLNRILQGSTALDRSSPQAASMYDFEEAREATGKCVT